MSSGEWKIPPAMQPKPEAYPYDLGQALRAVVGVSAHIPDDAFTAETLGTERAGHGVLIREDGLVLTIGYLITEAESVWLTLFDGRVLPGHVLGYDQETGFGLIQALGRVQAPFLKRGRSALSEVGERVVLAGHGGRERAVAARIVARQEFAGYWEYVLDEAIFTSPAHPNWGGTALIGDAGDLIGIGSLQMQAPREGRIEHINMVVPIDLLEPILDDLLTLGRPNRPARPWLGFFAAEQEDRVVVAGLAEGGPAASAGLRLGDVVMQVAGHEIDDLADLFRRIWAVGPAGAAILMSLERQGRRVDVTVASADRNSFLKSPVLH